MSFFLDENLTEEQKKDSEIMSILKTSVNAQAIREKMNARKMRRYEK